MSTTFTNEQVLVWIEKRILTDDQRKIIYQESYSDEVFIEGIKNYELSFLKIENPSDEVCLYVLRSTPWIFGYIKTPSYPVALEAIKLHPANLKKIPKEYRTEELVDLAIETSIQIRQKKPRAEVCQVASIPKALRTEERLKRMLQIDGKVLKYLNLQVEKNKNSDEQIRQAIQATPQSILEMDLMSLDEEYLILAVSLNGKLLKKIPQERWSESVVKAALQKDGSVISYILNPTYELLELVAEYHPHSLKLAKTSIPMNLYKKALYVSPWNLRTDDSESPSIATYIFNNTATVKEYSYLLNELMESKIPKVKDEGCFVGARYGGVFHPQMDLSTYFLALSSPIRKPSEKESVSVKNSPLRRQLEPWIEQTFYNEGDVESYQMDFRLKANGRLKEVKQDGLRLRGIPLENQSVKIVREAIKQNPKALKYADPNLKDYRLCRQAVQENPEVSCFSPYHVEDVVERQIEFWKTH